MSAPLIRTENLHKRFGDHAVLKGLSLDFEAGTTTVILGGSGSGKSVFMKHLIGLLRPDRGRVIVEGEELSRLTRADLNRIRRSFGMVFQMAALFDSMTVFENVAFPVREGGRHAESQIRSRVMERLEALDVAHAAHKYPAERSGGMRKRIGLARAVVLDPQIVLYDEPTTGLDPLTTRSVDEMILAAKAAFGVTGVVISHDIGSALRVADRLAFLHDGVIVEQGPPDAFRRSEHPEVRRFLDAWSDQLEGKRP